MVQKCQRNIQCVHCQKKVVPDRRQMLEKKLNNKYFLKPIVKSINDTVIVYLNLLSMPSPLVSKILTVAIFGITKKKFCGLM